MTFLKRLFGKKASPAPLNEQQLDQRWQAVYNARVQAFEASVGPLPADIQKLGNLLGIWPGGGLFAIPAPRHRQGAAVYTSFGLTNPDMPSPVTIRDLQTRSEGGQVASTSGTMVNKDRMPPARDWPGYGYEIMVFAEQGQHWPLYLLQWAVQAEIKTDCSLREQVEANGGLTVEEVHISESDYVHLLISKAQAPLPTTLSLPTGRADMLVMTVITDAEMQWSRQHGREALLRELIAAGVGQFSALDRASVVAMPDIGADQVLGFPHSDRAADFSDVTSLELALERCRKGHLEKILLFPQEFGGTDEPHNQQYVAAGVAAMKAQVVEALRTAVKAGLISSLEVKPEYNGSSFVPCKLVYLGSDAGGIVRFRRTILVW